MTIEMIPLPPCPECDKLRAVAKESQRIGEFIDWLRSRDVVLAQWVDGSDSQPYNPSMNQLLAEFFEIDLNKVEEERAALLKCLQDLSDGAPITAVEAACGHYEVDWMSIETEYQADGRAEIWQQGTCRQCGKDVVQTYAPEEIQEP